MTRKKHPDIQIGDVFGKLTVVALDKPSKRSIERMWLCKCKCGNLKVANDARLKSGHTKSCGCLYETVRQKKIIHGMSKSPLYAIWSSMKRRCSNANHKAYSRYGGRGINVCEEWSDSFEVFKDWALANGYNKGLTIDRIDNDKGYSPDNCRWVDRRTQSNNRSCNVSFSYGGETHTLAEWSRILNVKCVSLTKRYKSGWSIEDIINKPYRKHRPYKAKRKSEVDTK